jgi:hypothetical protein
MLLRVVLMIGLSLLAVGQSTPSPAPKSSDTIAADAVVLTIHGLCPQASASAAGCTTTVTRSEFDQLVAATNPNMPPESRLQLAQDYAHLLAVAQAAEKLNLDKNADYQAALNFASLQLLEQALNRELQRQAEQITPEEIEAAYRQDQTHYMQADILRVFIPDAPAASHEDEVGSSDVPMKELAEQIRSRAVAGANFKTLQSQAFRQAGLSGTPPATEMPSATPESLPGHAEVVFALKPGEVSPVLRNAAGFFVYKVVSKQTRPLDSVRAQIKREIAARKSEAAMKAISGAIKPELNSAYFPLPAAPLVKGSPEFDKALQQAREAQRQEQQ